MTSIDNTKFYQFISKIQADNEGGWNNYIDENYGNNDGTVIKAEFKKLMETEFDWTGVDNESEKKDIINKFWRSLDTNTSSGKIKGTSCDNLNALDDNEVDAVQARVEAYTLLNTFVEEFVTIPSSLEKYGTQWKSAVTEELSKIVEEHIAGGCKGDLNEKLTNALPGIVNTNLAEYCAIEYQDELKDTLKDYPEYKVADDATLKTLIANYVKTVNAETNAEQIKDAIISLVDAYFATAGIGAGKDEDLLKQYGYDSAKLNDLQIEVIRQTIANDLKAQVDGYKDKGYEAEFNEAVKQFIEAKLEEGGDFETLKAAASEFANSEFKTNLDNLISVKENYGDVKENSDFHKLLKDKFGDTLADKIVQNERYIQAYKDIINDVVEKLKAGELKMEDVENYIVEQISINLEKFFTNGLKDMSIEELGSTYDQLVEAAEAQEDDDKALQAHRDAAIMYCEALCSKGTTLEDAVKEVFGDDWKSQIGKLLPSEIKALIAELKVKAADIGESTNYTVSNWDTELEDSFNLSPNETLKNQKITANITDSNGKAIEANRIDYEVKISGGGNATIDKLGYLNITAPNNSGYMTIKVYARVDGIVVGEPKEITIICDAAYHKETIDEKDKAELATLSNFVGCGWVEKCGKKNPGAAITKAKATITTQIDSIVEMLKTKGYNSNKLEATAETLKNYYTALLDQVKDPDNKSHRGGTDRTASFSYTDANGETHQANAQYTHEARSNHKKMSAKPHTDSGILLQEDTSWRNDYRVVINMQVVAQKFIEIFNSL